MAAGQDLSRHTEQESSGRARSPRAGVAVPVLLVLILTAIVAIAAAGSTPSGSGRSTSPSDALLDTVFSLMIVALVVGLGVVVYAFLHWREIEWSEPRRQYGLRSLAAFLAFAFALVLYVRARGLHLAFDPEQTPLDRGQNGAPPPGLDAGSDPGYTFAFAWLPVLAVLVLAAIGVAAFVLSARRRRPSPREATLATELASALDLSLDDLRAEADPRRAVIAAYARLERVLAAHGEARRAADTPEEHVSRVLSHLAVDPRAVRRLADLFVQAKFSPHEVDDRMKGDAIRALEQVRDELRAAVEEPAVAPAPTEVPA